MACLVPIAKLNPTGPGPLTAGLKAAVDAIGTARPAQIVVVGDGADNCHQDSAPLRPTSPRIHPASRSRSSRSAFPPPIEGALPASPRRPAGIITTSPIPTASTRRSTKRPSLQSFHPARRLKPPPPEPMLRRRRRPARRCELPLACRGRRFARQCRYAGRFSNRATRPHWRKQRPRYFGQAACRKL